VSLILDDDRVIRSNITPHIAHCLLKPVIREELLDLTAEEERQEEANVQKYILRMSG
jgi:BarA-like signal transduction histidine kinase